MLRGTGTHAENEANTAVCATGTDTLAVLFCLLQFSGPIRLFMQYLPSSPGPRALADWVQGTNRLA